MSNTGYHFLPVLTSPAGLCLTPANLQEVGVYSGSYYLDSLLFKPGYELLRSSADVRIYFNCPGLLILNASKLVANQEGIFTLVSPFDGSKSQLSYAELIAMVMHIKPDAVILPAAILGDFPQLWEQWNEQVKPYVAVADLARHSVEIQAYGVYFNNTDSMSVTTGELRNWEHLPCYFQGDIPWDALEQLHSPGTHYIESDQPAQYALHGLVYSSAGLIDLTSPAYKMQFDTIDKQCICPTCTQQLSRAYLHHLFLHTPLLCQRFLIQHNIHFVQNSLKKISRN